MIKTNDEMKARIAREVDGIEDTFDDLAMEGVTYNIEDEEQERQWDDIRIGMDHEFLMQFLGYHHWVGSGMPRDTPWDEIRHQLYIINKEY